MANIKIYKCLSHICARTYRFKDILISFLPWKSRSRSWSAIMTITSFDGKFQNLQISSTHFALDLTLSDRAKPKFLMVDLQNLGQCHGVQFSQLHHSMASVKIYKCLPRIFLLVLTVCEKLIWPWKCRSRSQRRKTGLWLFDRKCLNEYCWFLFIILASGNIRKRMNFTYLKSKM